MGSLFSRPASVFAQLFAAYQSFKALETSSVDDDKQWLTFCTLTVAVFRRRRFVNSYCVLLRESHSLYIPDYYRQQIISLSNKQGLSMLFFTLLNISVSRYYRGWCVQCECRTCPIFSLQLPLSARASYFVLCSLLSCSSLNGFHHI
jgi:hypothetical protein